MLNINECERINLKKGDILTKAADKADKVYLIVNGKVSLRNSYIRMELENGSIVGMVDLYSKECLFDCMALADTAVLAFNVDGIEAIDGIKKQGVKVFAAHLNGSNTYTKEDYTGASAFLIGNEGNGLTNAITDKADALIKIPMEGQVESLNAAIACTILTYEAVRQRNL